MPRKGKRNLALAEKEKPTKKASIDQIEPEVMELWSMCTDSDKTTVLSEGGAWSKDKKTRRIKATKRGP